MKANVLFFMACALVLAVHLRLARPELFAVDRMFNSVLAGRDGGTDERTLE